MTKVKERELKDTYSSLSSRVILAGAADVFYNDPKAGRHEAITSRDTLNILADAISDVGS